MATQPSEKQGNSDRAEQPADITLSPTYVEDVHVSVGSAPSQSTGPPDISKVKVDGRYYRPLWQAAFRGDWESAKRFFERDSASKTAKITSKSETVLHVATLSTQDQFFENLVELLSPHPEVLEAVDCDGRTALHNAVLCGRIRMVKALVRINPKLTQLADNEGRVPLGISAQESSMHKEIVWFLAINTTDEGPSQPFSTSSAMNTIIHLTYAGHLDITLYLVKRYPHLLTMRSTENLNESMLDVFVLMQCHFLGGTKLSVLEALIYKCIPVDLNNKPTDKNSDPVPIIKRVHEVKLRHVTAVELIKRVCIAVHSNTTEIIDFFQHGERDLLFAATAKGNSDLLKLCIQFFPELIWISPRGRSLTTDAVRFRQERIVRLFLKASSTNELSLVPAPTSEESRMMMFVAAQYHPQFDALTKVAGATFQLQRELQWFKAVEKWVMPSARAQLKHNKSVWDLFTESHKELIHDGEKWVKDTADKCMLVSTLIATVLFAATFTVPGGNDDKTGVPLLLGHDSVLVFAISDALGLFSSVMAILLFLAILTSRYEPQDFLYSLPHKIIMGLCFLFLSLAFMLVAFAATLTIVLNKRLEWVLIPITLLASLPVALFLVLQLPLLYQMVKSTYGPNIFRPDGIWDGVKYTEQDHMMDEFYSRV